MCPFPGKPEMGTTQCFRVCSPKVALRICSRSCEHFPYNDAESPNISRLQELHLEETQLDMSLEHVVTFLNHLRTKQTLAPAKVFCRCRSPQARKQHVQSLCGKIAKEKTRNRPSLGRTGVQCFHRATIQSINFISSANDRILRQPSGDSQIC